MSDQVLRQQCPIPLQSDLLQLQVRSVLLHVRPRIANVSLGFPHLHLEGSGIDLRYTLVPRDGRIEVDIEASDRTGHISPYLNDIHRIHDPGGCHGRLNRPTIDLLRNVDVVGVGAMGTIGVSCNQEHPRTDDERHTHEGCIHCFCPLGHIHS